jgi:hypothetical protein
MRGCRAQSSQEVPADMPSFPARLLFRTVVACPYMSAAPQMDGDLNDWAGVKPLPHLSEVEGQSPVGDVYVGWNEDAVYVACRVPKTDPVIANRRRPDAGDGLQVIIDTRGVQTVHRATRFCHLFVLLPTGAGPERDRPIAWQAEVPQARESGRLCRPEEIPIGATTDTARGFYTIEAAFPAAILTGYEPRPGMRVGFQYWLHDVQRGQETYTVPPELQAMQDPSLWGLLELTR